ncbi:MAG: hypothetical protein PQJ59_02935 [Spirochaetales bacterium]|nr:hypothetical protein [Spirochaetales bacterium]
MENTDQSNIREGWEEAFKEMHNAGEDKLILNDLEEGDFEWE